MSGTYNLAYFEKHSTLPHIGNVSSCFNGREYIVSVLGLYDFRKQTERKHRNDV